MSHLHPPIGSPYQAPRDCVLFGWTLEEKEAIARAQRSSRTCWTCGRRYLGAKDFCSYDCEQGNRLCFSLARDDERERSVLDDRWTPDPLVVETAFMPDFVPSEHVPKPNEDRGRISAFCALCKTMLGPFKRRADATRGLRRHMKRHTQGEMFQ